MAYHTLVTKEQGRWCIQFGDYDKGVVQQEREDSYSGVPARIITTKTCKQREIDEVVGRL